MKASEMFGLIVRILGICVLVWSTWCLVSGLVLAAGIGAEETPGDHVYFVITGCLGIIFALVLIGGAGRIVRFSYPTDDGRS